MYTTMLFVTLVALGMFLLNNKEPLGGWRNILWPFPPYDSMVRLAMMMMMMVMMMTMMIMIVMLMMMEVMVMQCLIMSQREDHASGQRSCHSHVVQEHFPPF
jgi:hypothetical protein